LVGGAHTILVGPTDLPALTDAVVIDGSTEPDAGSGPVVVLDGAGAATTGLHVSASDTTVRGLVVSRFVANGLLIDSGAANVLVAGNRITNNAGAGIAVWQAGTGNALLGNLLQSNAQQGIDLNRDGAVQANDAGDADGAQNYPVLLGAYLRGGDTVVDGTLDTTAGTTLRIEFFAVPAASGDASGHGEAPVFLGFTEVTTDGAGTATFSAQLLGVTTAVGDLVTATATVKTGPATYGRTSEFSANQAVTSSAAPVLSFVSGLYNYPENTGAVVVAPSAVVSDTDSPNFSGGRAVVYFAANGQAEDRIAIRHQGSGAGQIGVSGNTVLYSGTVIGTWTGGTDGSTPLTISFNAAATQSATQALLRNITYANVSDNPSTAVRTMAGYLEDGAGGTSNTVSGLIRVVPSNDAPVARAGGPYAMAEGDSITLDASISSDPDDAVLAYAWDLDRDGVYGETGEPTAAGATVDWATLVALGLNDSGSYTVGVRVTDAQGASSVSAATLLIADRAPTLGVGGTGRVTAGQSYTLTLSASDAGADTITAWSIDWGDGAVTVHAGNPGSVTHTYTRSGGTFNVLATVTDEDGLHAQSVLQAHQVTVDNAAPVLTSDGGGASAARSLTENTTAVTTVTSIDVDQPGQTLTYSITGGADAARFVIDGATGALSFRTAPDCEVPGDANADNVYDVVVQVSDGALSDAQSIVVTVTAVNDNAPVITSGGAFGVAENTSTVTTVTAGDADLPGQPVSFSITGGADAALFAIDPATGALRFLVAPDREAPGDADADNVYGVVVQVSDGTLSDAQSIAVTVTAVNDNTPAITSGTAFSVAENGTAVTTVTSTDMDQPGQTLTYSIAGGADAARFVIDGAAGALSFRVAPDYETPGDADADNVYDVVVQASDGARSVTQSMAVSVTAVNDNAPYFIPQDGGGELSASVPEGERWSTVLNAADADAPVQALTFSISGGADAALFTLDPVSGLLAFRLTADHEVPQDANRDNAYEVEIDVQDGALTGHRTVTLRVANVNEAPALVTSQVAVEQGGRVVLDSDMLQSSDPDTDTAALVYTVSDVRSGAFERLAAPGQAVSQFTQADVAAGRVVFVQSGVGAAAASFELTVSDGGWTVGPRLVVVQVQPVAV
ncbi:MAG: hypothetical protein RLZZ373_421, partial [Pseudomonadota bacterium]